MKSRLSRRLDANGLNGTEAKTNRWIRGFKGLLQFAGKGKGFDKSGSDQIFDSLVKLFKACPKSGYSQTGGFVRCNQKRQSGRVKRSAKRQKRNGDSSNHSQSGQASPC